MAVRVGVGVGVRVTQSGHHAENKIERLINTLLNK